MLKRSGRPVSPNPATAEAAYRFARAMERSSQIAVAAAIARHRAAGQPVFYGDPDRDEMIVKELPDGRRLRVRIAEDGTETTID